MGNEGNDKEKLYAESLKNFTNKFLQFNIIKSFFSLLLFFVVLFALKSLLWSSPQVRIRPNVFTLWECEVRNSVFLQFQAEIKINSFKDTHRETQAQIK